MVIFCFLIHSRQSISLHARTLKFILWWNKNRCRWSERERAAMFLSIRRRYPRLCLRSTTPLCRPDVLGDHEDLLRLRHFHWLLLSETHLTVSSWICRAVSSLMVENAPIRQTLFLQPRCFYFCSQRCITWFRTLDRVLPLDSELYSSLSLSLEITKSRWRLVLRWKY